MSCGNVQSNMVATTVFPRINAAAFIYFAPEFGAAFIRGRRFIPVHENSYMRTTFHRTHRGLTEDFTTTPNTQHEPVKTWVIKR